MKVSYLILLLALCGVTLSYGSEALLISDNFDSATLGTASGISWAPGKDGQSAVLDAPGDSIEYPAEDFSPHAGRIEFDLMFPQALPKDHKSWCLFSDVGTGVAFPGVVIVWFREGSSTLEFGIFNNGFQWLSSRTTDWQPGQWYHLALGYGPGGMRLEVNGTLEASNTFTGGLARKPKTFGFHDPNLDSLPVRLDNLRVFRTNTDVLELYPPLVSPNGDGLFENCKISYELADDSTVPLSLTGTDGAVIKTFTEGKPDSAGVHTLTWDGGGVRDGRYQVVLAAARAGAPVVKNADLCVDTQWQWRPTTPQFGQTFPRGIYYICEDDSLYLNRRIDDPAKAQKYYDDTMVDLAARGFDLVIPVSPPLDHRQMMLDSAHKNGLRVIVTLDDVVHLLSSADAFDRENLFDLVWNSIKGIKDHPAVAGYYISDEPPANPALQRNIMLARKTVEMMDPRHPAFACLNNNYEDLLKAVDFQVLLTDLVYPIFTSFNGDFAAPYLPGAQLGFISDLDRAQRNAGARPLWVVVQAFGKPGVWRIPTPEELRAQVWLSLAYGAKGIVHFIYQSTTQFQGEYLQGLVDMNLKPMDGRLDEVARLNAALKTLAPILLTLQPAPFTVPVGVPSVVTRGFTDPQGIRYVILVNKDVKQVAAFQWTGEPGVDVLTGAKILSTISLQPGAGLVVRMNKGR